VEANGDVYGNERMKEKGIEKEEIRIIGVPKCGKRKDAIPKQAATGHSKFK